ncbi:MAG: hypothetical protein Q9222_005240, partial [Ikaeria aurantiellina]
MGSNTAIPPLQTVIENMQFYTNAPNIPENDRMQLVQAARDLYFSQETPRDLSLRYRYSALDIAITKIFYDIRLIDQLISHEDTPASVAELAKETNTDPALLRRLLRYAASPSVQIIKQVSEDGFITSRLTHRLSLESSKANIEQAYIGVLPYFGDMASFFADTKYDNPSDSCGTIHQHLFKTKMPWFPWAQSQPEQYQSLQRLMATMMHHKTGIDIFPFDEQLQHLFDKSKPMAPDTSVFVDVGGGRGQMARALRKRYPDLQGRFVVQDLQETFTGLEETPGIELMALDFFKPQPVKGAKIYYLRRICHDWPDSKALLILQNVKDAMAEDSVILIDEIVLPNVGAPTMATGLDLTMMSHNAGGERSEAQWKQMLGSVGLEVKGTWKYDEEEGDSVMLVLP